ncbi:SHOCT domain-containing protein [Streptomyces sp. NBC_01363]|uniref:SHOCT domain-containing protein n=1 Tax=Streptomyces sp. NBC_01363 TaxID=2903840 RepID=UPI0022527087|nr:SHOCT domain-containing protein [Streptomyces sp. NBC_01363]MCX4733667.1 SHOCT domain-containing protein [Streptomyces sp. NBC_01363]
MPGLLRGVARTAVIAGTATSVSNRVSRRQAGRWARQDAEQAQPRPAPAAPPPPAPTALAPEDEMSNKIAQLKDLGDLKSQGVLSESEFEAQKARILAG